MTVSRRSGGQNWRGSDVIGERLASLMISSSSLSINPSVSIASAFPRGLKAISMKGNSAFACVTMFDPLLCARARPVLPPFVLGTPETRRAAFPCFSAIVHANHFIRNPSPKDVGARYRNRYPDTRHMSAANIVVISFALATGSMVVEVYPQKITRPEGTSNARRSCWRRSSFELNLTSGA